MSYAAQPSHRSENNFAGPFPGPLTTVQRDGRAPEPLQRRLKILRDLRRDLLRRRQKVGVVEGVVLEPENAPEGAIACR